MRSFTAPRRLRAATATALVMVGALLASGLAACSGGKDELTMWIYPVVLDESRHKKFWDKTVADFEKKNPDIQVKVNINPWENRDQALATARAGGKGPDVIYLIPDQLPKFNDSLVDAKSYLPKATLADYRKNAVSAVTPDKTMLAAPLLMTIQTPVCNQKVFDAVGVKEFPTTWEDLAALGPKFKAKGYFLTDFAAHPAASLNLTYYPFLWQAGGDVYKEGGKSVAFNSPQGLEALSYLERLVDAKLVEPESLTKNLSPEQTAAFKGKVACVMSAAPKELIEPWGESNIKILKPLQNKVDSTYGTVGSLGVFKDSDQKEAAGKFISYVASKEVMKEYLAIPGYFSPRSSQSSLYTGDPILGEQEKYLDMANVGPLEPQAREVNAALAPEIQSALLGKKSSKEALADGEKAANALIK